MLDARSVNATDHPLMASGVMRGALEGQELVDGRYGCSVCGPNADLGTAWTIGGVVGDAGVASHHDGGAWDYLGVHLEGSGKVSGSKRRGYITHVLSDGGNPNGVGEGVCVEDDTPAIREVLKDVRRRVLIHAHDSLSACLHDRERWIRLASSRLAPAPAPGEGNGEGDGQDLRGVLSCHEWLVGA